MKIKRCPHCGKPPLLSKVPKHSNNLKVIGYEYQYYCTCIDVYETEDEALKAWNKRKRY